MSDWSYICPYCKQKVRTTHSTSDMSFYINKLITCPFCLNILRINSDFTTSDFQKILKENAGKRKAESKLQERETVEVIE